MNYCAIFVLLIIMLLHNFAQDEKWNVGNYLSQIVVSVFGALAYVTKPFYDASAFYKSRRKKADSKGTYIVIGVLISCVCVFFLGLLLMSADSVFEDIVMSIFENICLPDRMFSVLFMLCFGFFSSYCGMRYLEEHGKTMQMKDKKNGEPLIAIIVTGSIAAMYLMFCAIQVVYLFVGRRYLMGGNAYAEYVREGFFQLLFVCMINLFLVLTMKNRVRESKVLNVILMIICACTFIMIASSAYRMIMYIEKYHLTFLRVFVLVALFVITLLMLGVIAMIAKPEFSFFRYALVTVSVVYLIFSFAHVDYFIAKYNLAQSNGCETDSYSRGVDYYYIIDSSTDCAPAVAEFAKEHGIEDSWVERYINAHESEMNDINIRNFNVSHYVAHCLLSE